MATLQSLLLILEDKVEYARDLLLAKEILTSLMKQHPLTDVSIPLGERLLFIKISFRVMNLLLDPSTKDKWGVTYKIFGADEPLDLIFNVDLFSSDVIVFMKTNRIEKFTSENDNIDAEFLLLTTLSESSVYLPVDADDKETFIKIPAKAFKEIELDHGQYGISSVIYPHGSDVIHSSESDLVIGSAIISSTIHPKLSEPFPKPIEINFLHTMLGNNSECVFLTKFDNLPNISWSRDGCYVLETSLEETVCACNHLTNFALLMQPVPIEISEIHHKVLSIITFIGCGISMATLLVTFITIVYFRLNSDRVTILQNMVMALLMAQFIFLIGIDATENQEGVCRFIAILLHYLYLATFFWMMVQGMLLYSKIKNVFNQSSKIVQFLVIGWGVPLVIVGISAGLKWRSYGNENYCWLSFDGGLPAAFIAPAMTVILMNIFVLGMVIRAFMSVRVNAKKTEVEKMRAGIRAAVILTPLLGLTWIFGVLAVNGDTLVFQYLFTMTNSLQGLMVFLFHCCLNDEVKAAYNRKFKRQTQSREVKYTHGKATEAWADTTTTTNAIKKPFEIIEKSDDKKLSTI
ncbi:adhesion G-protein coupled receptor D1-like [Glandiceps talaboti]